MKTFDTKRIKEISDKINKIPKNVVSEVSMRELNKRMRKLNENTDQITIPESELSVEIQKFKNVFRDYNVSFEFENFIILNGGIIWGGSLDNQIQWVYKVTDDDTTSGVELNFAPEFNPDEEDNKKLIDLIENYYNIFFKYCRDNFINVSNKPTV